MAISAPEKALREEMASMAGDPLSFVYFSFPWGEGELKDHKGPDYWQVDILNRVKSGLLTLEQALKIAVASGHGVGKSALVCWLILWGISTREDTMGVVTANTETQLKTKTWAQLSKWYQMFIAKHWFTLTATALYSTDKDHERTWRFDMIPWSEKNTEAFAGLHNAGKRLIVIFDEASAIVDKIWEVTEGALTDVDTEMLWFAFGNPTLNTGRFKECWGRFRSRWSTIQVDSRTSRLTNKAQIQEWIDDYGIDSDFVKIRVRGMFPNMSAKHFITTSDADAGYGKSLRPEQYQFAAKVLTCDPAWEGDDELVIGLRQGLAFSILRVIPKNDNDIQIASILAALEDEHSADAVFVDAGYGTGIVSAGQTMHRNWQLVWFSASSPDPGYVNMRAYMWGQMRDWLKQGGAYPKDQAMYQDLIGPETVPRMDGKIQLESKSDMKKRGIPSPNKADSCALSFAFPVHKVRQIGEPGYKREHVEPDDWSPFDFL